MNNDAPQPKRILVVEDHVDTTEALARLLRRDGYQVDVARSLAEARGLWGAQKYDLLISDLGLPDGSGFHLLAEFRMSQTCPAIALSGYGMEENIRDSKAAGFAAHLIKPVDVPYLRKTVAEVIAG